ncbi:hypothetical protein SMALB_3413 [Streptomyces malaysiensis]|uniref:ABC3 transporter permease C-terminal domain-containing protein n=1 Tax=Streptomyces malaysiensis TaxID=92644 RepID=A0A7X5X2M7_STRMQ|nr:hypothetical protein [Streptomyces malaysiensis]
MAVDALLAKAAHARVGHRLALHLPDGTKISPTVVAIYGRGLGIAELTLPRAALIGHVTSSFDSDVLVRDAGGADRKAVAAVLGRIGEDVTDPDGYPAAQDEDRKLNAWANTVMAGVPGGFAVVAAANTLVMTVLDRRRELSTLRPIGTTRRQVLGMVRWEALLVATAGIAAIALATLVPMTRGLTGEGPYVPPLVYAGFAGTAVALGLAATALPARVALRRAKP